MLTKKINSLIISAILTASIIVPNSSVLAATSGISKNTNNIEISNTESKSIYEVQDIELKNFLDKFEESNPKFTSECDDIGTELFNFYLNNEKSYSQSAREVYRNFINFFIRNRVFLHDQNMDILRDEFTTYCKREKFKEYGIEGDLLRWNSAERDYDWYIDQGSTGSNNTLNCVPSSLIMTMKYFDKNTTETADNIRKTVSRPCGGLDANDITKVLEKDGFDHEYIGYDTEKDFKEWIERSIDIGGLCMMTVNMGSVPMRLNGTRVGKFYSGSWNHCIVIKGYIETDKNFYLEVYDPFSMGSKYSDGQLIGKDTYYTANSLCDGNILKITGSSVFKGNIGKTFNGIIYVGGKN